MGGAGVRGWMGRWVVGDGQVDGGVDGWMNGWVGVWMGG